MPFEFSGAPPALLDTTSGFSSFASASSYSQASQPTSSGSSTSFASPAPPTAFGSSASFSAPSARTTAPAFGTGFSFGQTAKATFGSISTWPSSSFAPQCNTPTATTSLPASSSAITASTPEPAADDLLSRALIRASKGRSAIFGRKDIAADGILKNILKDTEHGKRDVQILLQSLRTVEAVSPPFVLFVRSLFDEFARTQAPADEAPARHGFLAAAPSLTEASSNTAGHTVKERHGNIRHRDSKTLPLDPPVIVLPRHHMRTKKISGELAETLYERGYIWYAEGARVLGNHIVDLIYEDTPEVVTEKIVTLIARPDLRKNVNDLVFWAKGKVYLTKEIYDLYQEEDEDVGTESDTSGKDEEPVNATSDDASPKTDMVIAKVDDRPFRFLDLPAELRNWVYQELMVPGYIGLREEYRYSKSDQVLSKIKYSTCVTDILATCRQIHNEAKDVLFENTVCLTIDMYGCLCSRPVLPETLLPDCTLSRLTSLTIVAANPRLPNRREDFDRVNWKQFQAMTSLKHLRISIIEQGSKDTDTNERKWMLEQIMERIPKDCELEFETMEGFEDEFAVGAIEALDDLMKRRKLVPYVEAYEVDGDLLRPLAKEFYYKQGCKSGSKKDFRFRDRGFNLNPLVPAGEVDPSIVLGGDQ